MAPTAAATSTISSSIFSASSLSLSRPTTRDGSDPHHVSSASTSKERKASSTRRRGTWTAPASTNSVVTDAAAPPALPDYALTAAGKVATWDKDKDRRNAVEGPWSPLSPNDMSNMPNRMTTATTVHIPAPTPEGRSVMNGALWQQSESLLIHQQMTDVIHKRISTLDYLRKASVALSLM